MEALVVKVDVVEMLMVALEEVIAMEVMAGEMVVRRAAEEVAMAVMVEEVTEVEVMVVMTEVKEGHWW